MTSIATDKSNLRKILLQYIRRHADGDRIPSERELSTELGVNRYLVRKCLDDLVKEQVISRKCRSGMYLNQNTRSVPCYGLISGDGGSSSYIDAPNMTAGALRCFAERRCLVRNVTFRMIEQIPDRVRKLGLKGVLWLETGIGSLSTLAEILYQSHIPLVIASTNYYELPAAFHSNYITVDNDWFCRARVRSLFAEGCRKPVYFSSKNKTYQYFTDELKRLGMSSRLESLITNPTLFPAVMDRLRAKNQVDGILCDGVIGHYEALFRYLHEHPDFRPALSLEDHPRVREQMRLYPEIPVKFPFVPYSDWSMTMGETAAETLLRTSAENPITPAILWKPEIRKGSSLEEFYPNSTNLNHTDEKKEN